MNNRGNIRGLAVLLAAVLAIMLIGMPIKGIADVGGYSGDSDYGGGDWGGSSDWDSGSDWGGSSYYGGSSGGDEFTPGSLIIVVIIVIVIIAINMMKNKGSVRTGNQPRPAGATPTAQSSLRPISELRATDYNFSEAMFQEKVAKMYVDMQAAWQAKNFEPMRPYFTEELYTQFARQLKEGFIDRGLTNKVERISVLDARIMGFRQDDRNDAVVVRLNTRIVDYVVRDSDGSVVRGDSSRELFMDYEWTLIRPKGQVTPTDEELNSMHCPSCGAPVDINRSAVCEYCGTVLVNAEHDWVISQIKGISQRTA